MSTNDSKSAERTGWIIIGIFISTLIIGGFLPILVALGIIPAAPEKIHAPRWVLLAAGSVFVGAGVYLIQLVLRRREDLRWTYFFNAGMQTIIAVVSGWVAFGDGSREFWRDQRVGLMTFHSPATESYGRLIFGFACISVGVLAAFSWRKFFLSLRSTN